MIPGWTRVYTVDVRMTEQTNRGIADIKKGFNDEIL